MTPLTTHPAAAAALLTTALHPADDRTLRTDPS
jgi:hypothetical protein